MELDPARASLVMQPYRYTIAEDAGIKNLFPKAREVVIDTNLDAAGASAMATAIFNSTKGYAREFDVTVEDVYFLSDFTSSPPRFIVNFDRHPAGGTNIIYTVMKAKIDYQNRRTTLTVRG